MNARGNARVVVGVSGTYAGYQAVRYAVAEARRLGRPLVAVRTYQAGYSGLGEMLRTALESAAREEIGRVFADALGGVPADVAVTGLVTEGRPGAILTDAADRPDDLLVIGGSGQRRIFGRRGAIAAECSRRAACPVVIVPPPSLARTGPESRLARDAALGIEAYLDSVPVAGG